MTRIWATPLLLLLFGRAALGQEFVHPAGLYAMPLPEGCAVSSHLDLDGTPYEVFAPAGEAAPARGLWIWALPVATGERPLAKALAKAAVARVTAGEGALSAVESASGFVLWGERAPGWDVGGQRGGKAWKGVASVACHNDVVFVMLAGGAPEEAAAIVAGAAASLARLVAPVPVAPRHPSAGKPVEPPDIAEHSIAAAPMVSVLARSGANWSVCGYGSAFLITAEGYAVTNHHVVARIEAGEGSVRREAFDPVLLSWDHSVRKDSVMAEVVAVASRSDLALLRLSGKGPWPFCPITPPGDIKAGHGLLVMGWPSPPNFGTTAITINEGTLATIVGDPFRRPSSFRVGGGVTTHGNSGGPVFDLDLGGVAGVLTEGMPYEHKDGLVEYLYRGLVPTYRVLDEFPQIAAGGGPPRTVGEARAAVLTFLAQRRHGAALLGCRRLEELSPGDGIAQLCRFRVYRYFRDPERAKAPLLAALRRPESRWLAVIAAGRAAIDDGDIADGEGWSKQANELDPQRPEGRLLLGHARYQAGRWEEARSEFFDAAKLGYMVHLEGDLLAEAEAMQGLSMAQQALDGWNGTPIPLSLAMRAEELLLRSLETRPYGNGIAHAGLGLVRLLSGAPGEVDAAVEGALGCAPEGARRIFDSTDKTLEHFGTWDLDALAGAAHLLLTRAAGGSDLNVALGALQRARLVRPSAFTAYLLGRWQMIVAKSVNRKDLFPRAAALFAEAERRGPQTVWARKAEQLRRTLQ